MLKSMNLKCCKCRHGYKLSQGWRYDNEHFSGFSVKSTDRFWKIKIETTMQLRKYTSTKTVQIYLKFGNSGSALVTYLNFTANYLNSTFFCVLSGSVAFRMDVRVPRRSPTFTFTSGELAFAINHTCYKSLLEISVAAIPPPPISKKWEKGMLKRERNKM